MTNYSSETDVYEATGLNTKVVQNLSGKSEAEVTTLITGYITKADQMIKRLLGVPYTVRKEYHQFDRNLTIELGPSEDEFGFFADYDPADCVDAVYAVYAFSRRVKLPYPKDCDSLTEDITDMDKSSGCTISKETTIKKCGTASIKAIFTAVNDYFWISKSKNMDKNIDTWDFIGFWFRTSDKTATFTITLYDKDGGYTYKTFACTHADTWTLISLDICDDFVSGTLKGTDFNEDHKVQYIEIKTNKACTVYFDNFNFNDGYFWTYPEGLICWSDPDEDAPISAIRVTYAYDPFKVTIPEDIKAASAKKAGILLLEYLIGCRQRVTAFMQTQEDLDQYPDRETLEFTKARLEREIIEILAGLGFRAYSGMNAE